MPLIQWDETMSLDMDELDEQHRELIDLINEAFDAIQRNDERCMAPLIDKMRDYAVVHFEAEEAILRSCGYPESEVHAGQHRVFEEKVEEFRRNLAAQANLSQVFIFLSRWLTSHIMHEDRKFLPWLPETDDEGA
ncbi:hemerythrin-like metal-binding protein [Pseudodesulfovibrio mercurii]|uniref:Hemerythrin-like metal-binding protein n=1 Tax=Pseudodesulfovibrio mercurii TaxID=641491 RepID=F0JHY2_9BACT|nr:bacteriohemerythrin [Pseudodesulfovibrio mercurii]EGB14112.1 hemerythrin-like metal-binding protein [Pseudodesulfovibrio mercurii]